MAAKISLDKLRRDLSVHTLPFFDNDGEPNPTTFQLADRVIAYCQEQRLPSPAGNGVNHPVCVTHLGTKQYSIWVGDEASAYFAERIKLPPQDEEDAEPSVWTKPGTLAFQTAAARLLSSQFIISPNSENAMQLYKIESWETRQVVPVIGTPKDVSIVISRAVVNELEREGVAVTQERIGLMSTAFYAKAAAEPPPQLHGQLHDDRWCLHRATVQPDATVPFPHITMFLDRLNDSDAFCGWVWGTYSGENKGRQIPYIEDLEGAGAKSVILKTIGMELFGDRIYTAFPPGASANDPHMNSHFLGKRLVVIGDCKNPYILHSGVLKELSGDDKTFVNPKYQQPYSVHFDCRVIIASNDPPFMVREAHNTSRTMYLQLRPLLIPDAERDVNYGRKCAAELPGFLAHAKACYERLCPNHYAIQTNAAVAEATELRISQCETLYSSAFDEHFEVDAEGIVTYREWARVIKELKLDVHRAQDLLQWIMAVHGATASTDPKRKTAWALEGVRIKSHLFGGGHNFPMTMPEAI